MNHKTLRISAVLAATALLLLVPVGLAFEERGGDHLVIPSGEVILDDLYAAAESFTLEGRVQGDLIVFARTVTLNGIVDGDVFAFAQTVEVNGFIEDDLRAMAMSVTLGSGATIGSDVAAAAFSLETRPDTSFAGVLYAGAQALLDGEIRGNARVYASGLEVRGRIAGDLAADVGDGEGTSFYSPSMFMTDGPALPNVAGGLTITEGASIEGDLEYSSPAEARIASGAVIGKTLFTMTQGGDEKHAPDQPTAVSFLRQSWRRFAALVLVGLLLAWLAPSFATRTADTIQARPLASLGWGIVAIAGVALAFLVILVLMILLAVILGTLSIEPLVATTIVVGLLGLIALPVLFGLAISYGAQISVSFLGGRWVLSRLTPSMGSSRIWPIVVGVVMLILLTAIPILGGLVGSVVALLGLGGMALVLLAALRRASPPPTVPIFVVPPARPPAPSPRKTATRGAPRRAPRRAPPRRRATR